MKNAHIFEISKEVWDSITAEEVVLTAEDMRELGIYRMPYAGPLVLRVPFDIPEKMRKFDRDRESRGPADAAMDEYIYANGAILRRTIIPFDMAPEKRVNGERLIREAYKDNGGYYDRKERAIVIPGFTSEGYAEFCMDALVVILASKGIEKQTTRNKLAALGIGKDKPAYVTKIALSHYLPDDADHPPGAGRERRPHLRRGHIRHQHHGKGNQLVKTIWIEPTFVNGDASFFDTRTKYVVKSSMRQ